MALSGLVGMTESGAVLVGIAGRLGGYCGWRLLSVDGSLPGVAGPSVVGECGHQDDDGLVVQLPGGESAVVEGAFELRIERFSVGSHGVHASVVAVSGTAPSLESSGDLRPPPTVGARTSRSCTSTNWTPLALHEVRCLR